MAFVYQNVFLISLLSGIFLPKYYISFYLYIAIKLFISESLSTAPLCSIDVFSIPQEIAAY